jgi:hypothetical protein
VLRSAHRDPRGERRDRVVPDELVDDLGDLPERGHVDVALHPGAGQGAGQGLAGDAVQRQRDRVNGARDEVRSCPRRLERGGETAARGALAVEPDRETAALP